MPISIGKNTVYNIIKTLSTIVFPLITFPYACRVLGVDNVGKVNFASSIISYISLIASLGVSTYAIRECSRVCDDKAQLAQIASEIFSINIFSTILAYVILTVLLIFWSKLENYKILILLYGIKVLMFTLGADWLNSAMEDFKYITLRTFAFQMLSLVMLFIFVHKPDDYYIYAAVTVLSSSGGNLLNVFYRRKYCKVRFLAFHKTIGDSSADIGTTMYRGIHWKKHMPPIMMLFALMLAQTVFVSVDTTMLGIMRDDREVGLYSASTQVYNMVNVVVASIAFVVMPQLSYWFRKSGDCRKAGMPVEPVYAEINKLLKYSLNFIIVLGLPCVVGLFALAPDVIELVGGKAYFDAVPSLRILCVALFFSLLGGFVGNIILLPSGRDSVCLISSMVSALVNLMLNLIMIPRWGLNAAAFTTAVSQFIALMMELPFIEKEVKFGNVLTMVFAPVIGCLVIAVIVIEIQRCGLNLGLRVVLAVVLSAIAYAMILLLLRNEFAMNTSKIFKNKINLILHK